MWGVNPELNPGFGVLVGGREGASSATILYTHHLSLHYPAVLNRGLASVLYIEIVQGVSSNCHLIDLKSRSVKEEKD
jgi:hypothetical protein